MALPSLSESSLRPGDVLFMGVFGTESEDRLFSDVISCFNGWGKLALPERFAGVSCALACHVALYVGQGRFVHATGPGATFLLATDEIDAYLAHHPRLVTVLRCVDEGFAEEAAAIGRTLAKASGNARDFQGAALVLDLVLQGMFPGRRDEEMLRGFRQALMSGEGCLLTTPCVVSCGAFVATTLRLAIGSEEQAALVDGMPCDISPFEMLVLLLKNPRWRVVARHQPAGLEQRIGAPTSARCLGARPGPRWADLPLVLGALLAVLSILAVFFLGFGRALQEKMVACTTAPDDRGERPRVGAEGALRSGNRLERHPLAFQPFCARKIWVKPTPPELRLKIVEAYEDGEGSVDDLADRFGVHRSTVLNLLKLKRETGLLAPRPHGGGNPGKLNADDLAELRKIVEEKNDLTHPQLAEELNRRRGSDVRRSTIERALRLKLGLTRKKKR